MKNMRRAAAAVAVSSAALLGAAMLVPTAASAAAPAAPTGLTPDDTSSAQYKNLELRWNPVSGASGYEVQVSDDGDFDRATSLTASTVAPRWTAPTTLPFGDYAWRVRAVTAAGPTSWSAANFTRGWTGAPPSPTNVVEPVSQATNFSWGAIPDASFYELQVLPATKDGRNPLAGADTADPYGATTLPHWTCYTAHAAFSPYASPVVEDNTPGDESGCFLGTTVEPKPTAALAVTTAGRTVTSDASGSKATARSPLTTYRYTFGDGSPAVTSDQSSVSHDYPPVARSYKLTLVVYTASGAASDPVTTDVAVDPATVAPAAAPVAGSPSLEPDDVALGSALTPGTYYWRVRGRDATVDTTASGFPDSSLACSGVWYDSQSKEHYDAAGNIDAYLLPRPGTAPVGQPTPECSNWSAVQSFTITADPQTVGDQLLAAPAGLRAEPTLGDPTGAVVALTDTPMLRWDRIPYAAKYRVYVSRTADFRNPDHVYETDSTSVAPVGTYADRSLKTYWTVQGCTGHKVCGPVASARAFTKDARVNVRDAQTSVSGRFATMSWDTQFNPARVAGQSVPLATEAKAYQLQVALEGAFDKPAVDVVTDRIADSVDTGTSRYTADVSALSDGRYTWRVRPIDQSDRRLKWSLSTGSFLRDTAAPQVTLVTPRGFSGRTPLALHVSEPVVGGSGTTLGLVAGSTRAKVAGRLVQLGLLDYRFTPTASWVANESYTAFVTTAVRDRAGKPASVTSGPVRAGAMVDSASVALVRRTGDYAWSVRSASDALGRSYIVSSDRTSTTRQSAASTTVRGVTVTVVACKSPGSGRLGIRLDGTLVKTIDLYRHYSGCLTVWTSARLADRQHTVQLVALGTRNASSKGTIIGVDAVRVR